MVVRLVPADAFSFVKASIAFCFTLSDKSNLEFIAFATSALVSNTINPGVFLLFWIAFFLDLFILYSLVASRTTLLSTLSEFNLILAFSMYSLYSVGLDVSIRANSFLYPELIKSSWTFLSIENSKTFLSIIFLSALVLIKADISALIVDAWFWDSTSNSDPAPVRPFKGFSKIELALFSIAFLAFAKSFLIAFIESSAFVFKSGSVKASKLFSLFLKAPSNSITFFA